MPKKSISSKTAKAKIPSLKAQAKLPARLALPIRPKINIIYILVILLIIASFLIGMLFTKVSYLEDNNNLQANIDANDLLGEDTQAIEPVDVSEGHLPVLGNKDAKVTLVEFSDFQCPFCKTLSEETLPLIKKDYVDTGKIKFAYRHYPIAGIHPNAQKAAEASECANEQGNFWGMHDELFKNQTDWESLPADQALNKFAEFANNIGLNGAALSECVTSGKYEDEVKKDLDDGTAAGVDGTPATYINGIKISGAAPYEDFKAEIEKALSAN